jgi:NSS family neurotransmitter:Na+ symporter
VKRDQWQSRIGFILAATGSAIGLGNLWKFPYITWHNNGGAFVLVYLVSVAIVGLPIMMAEILIGRKTNKSPVPAFLTLGGKGWGLVGGLGVLTGFVILGYYSVIAGWTLSSFVNCLDWSFNGYVAPADGAFGEFLSNGPLQLLLTALFSTATIFVVWFGVGKGIERCTRILMPVLLTIMAYLLVTVLFMPGRDQALTFLFRPNFSQLPMSGILESLGHAFFTLSLGMGVMITYGSYLRGTESLTRISLIVVVMDTLIAIVACMIMYTIIFSVPGMEDQVAGSTIGMLFLTLPNVFYTQMGAGTVIGPLFYILVAFAALTSTISVLEVIVSFFIDHLGWKRRRAAIVAGLMTYCLSILCAMSLGALDLMSTFEIFGGKAGLLSTLDHVAANWMLPLGGLLTTIFVGWFLKRAIKLEQLRLTDEVGNPTAWYKIWHFLVRSERAQHAVPLHLMYIDCPNTGAWPQATCHLYCGRRLSRPAPNSLWAADLSVCPSSRPDRLTFRQVP